MVAQKEKSRDQSHKDSQSSSLKDELDWTEMKEIKRLTRSLGFMFWAPSIPVPRLMANYPIVVETFLSGGHC